MAKSVSRLSLGLPTKSLLQVPNQGDRISEALSSADAWVGTHRFRPQSVDDYDPGVWTQRLSSPVDVPLDAATLVHLQSDPSMAVYQVKVATERSFKADAIYFEPWFAHLFRSRYSAKNPDPKQFYKHVTTPVVRRAFYTFVFVFDLETANYRTAVGLPGPDGYLAIYSVLSDADRLLPLQICWRGQQIDPDELVNRVRLAVSFLFHLQLRPKVPSPILPPELLDSIETARRGGESRQDKRILVDQLLEVDSTSFLEALDRLLPWIDQGQAGWLDKEDRVADRLWNLLFDMEKDQISTRGRLRLAPWKTGLGQPKGLGLYVEQVVPGDLDPEDRIYLTRNPFGSYDFRRGRPW